MKEMALSVVIPTRGHLRALSRLVNSLRWQKLEAPFEVLIVENLTGDIAKSLRHELELWPSLKILTCGQRGANAARNLGLHQSQGDVVLFLDDDCEAPDPLYLSRVLAAHLRAPDVCAIGGEYRDPPGLKGVARIYQEIARHWIRASHDNQGRQLQLIGGCVSYKRRLLNDLRFDPAIEFGGTETELHERLRARGLTLELDQTLSNIHHCQLSLWSFLRKSFLQGQGHTRRQTSRLTAPSPAAAPSVARPKGFLVELYDLAFVAGKSWASRHQNYRNPKAWTVLAHILGQAPDFYRRKWKLDAESLHWKMRRRLQTVRHVMRQAAWRSFAITARTRGAMIDWRWRLYNYRNDMKLAWLGYGNHRVFERFALKPLPPPRYFQTNEVVRLSSAEFELLDEATLSKLEAFGRTLLIHCGDTALGGEFLKKFNEWRTRIYGLVLTLGPKFDFRRVLPLWNDLDLPVFLETDANPECVDVIYDHLKAIYYMGQARAPKRIYTSCVLPAEEAPSGVEKRFVTRLSERPKLSFVIPIYNNVDYITRVLEHIEAQQAPREDWEIVAVDDGSEQCVVALIERWAAEKPAMNLTALRWSRRLSDGRYDDSFRAGRARNLGVRHARGEHLAFLDSDILVAPTFLAEIDALLKQHDVIQFSRQMVRQKPLEQLHYHRITALDLYRESSYWEDFKRAEAWADLKNFWKYTCTYCLVMRQEDFHRAGGFKNSFRTYGFEDVDIGYRLAQLGRRFHLSKTPAYHLYPVPTDHSQHFHPQRRQRSLALSCRRFYFMNLDPEIYRDLYTVLNPPTSTLFRALRTLGRWGRRSLRVFRWRPWTAAAREGEYA